MGGKGSGRRSELPDVSTGQSAKKAATVKVKTPSGTYVHLLSNTEANYYKTVVEDYTKNFNPSGFSDLDALGRIALQHVITNRYQTAIGRGQTIQGDPLPPALEKEYRQGIKESESLAKLMREESGFVRSVESVDSPANWIKGLMVKAKHFGVMREKQLIRALVMFNELRSNIEAYDRSNAKEREHLGFESAEDILEWIREQIPEYEAIDKHFTENEQRYWTEPASDS